MANIKPSLVEGFDEFWRAYPLKKDRIAAERAWKRLNAADRKEALAGIAPYAAECTRRGVHLMYGQGYLNRRRWEDEPDALPPVGSVATDRKPDLKQTPGNDNYNGQEAW